ncbi:MAG: ABC transporter ATP-binding protein [Spirochaetales bacterium]
MGTDTMEPKRSVRSRRAAPADLGRVPLSVSGLSKSYGEISALREVSFTVARGEIFGILGPNGSGKTTTIECVLGTRTRDGGEVEVLGLDPRANRRELFRRVGVQFQDSAWQPSIRVAEICEVTAAFYTPEPDWQALLREFDLEKRAATEVASLSGGERQKLSILLACMHQPELVFLDELTTGLDPIARRGTWRFIKLLSERGATVVLSSHYMDEVEALCDRALVLRSGEKIADGSIEQIKAQGSALLGRDATLEDSYIALAGGEE